VIRFATNRAVVRQTDQAWVAVLGQKQPASLNSAAERGRARLRLLALAFEVRVSEFRVAVTPCILVCPALVPALSLDLLPDNRVVLCADKGVAPPVGWAKDLQQLALDGIDVLQPLFQGILVLMPGPHDEPPAVQRNSPDPSQGTPAERNAVLQRAMSHCCFSF
jgi:hypothetical protein